MRSFRNTIWFFVFWVVFLGLSPNPAVFAQELSYDRYAPRIAPPEEPSSGKKIASHFPVYPFELIRWPVDKALILIEKHAIDKKIKWLYDQALDHGITPQVNILSFGSLGGGADIDFIRLLGQKQNFPNQTLKAWASAIYRVHYETGVKAGWERIAETGFHGFGLFRYENRPQEHFYGIGPDSSKGDGTTYRMETTLIEPSFGYDWSPELSSDIKFAWKNINITNGLDGADIDRSFPGKVIPGLGGDQIVTVGGQIKHDTRNHDTDSSQGGMERLEINFNEGINSEARYFQYVTEISRYVKIGSPRRVFAFHFYGEHNNELSHHHVPFHQMAKLGGYGEYPRMSHTLRGYDFNRFFDSSAVLFNLEYRYTIWEHKEFKMDTVIFWDEGQVFNKFGKFKFRDFRESYGGGVRVSLAHVTLLSVEIAHADEGTNLYVKSSAPF
ncbi:MAG: BamA/TamA family outer membrane protein [Candidatus Omnitrophica bacterium]|nr:BamA/TamA family outer membrane protein [Candidatus Omnitrophota bacterium]